MSQPCNCAFLQSSPDTKGKGEGVLGAGGGMGGGGISRGRWKVGGTRLEIVDHIQFWGLRSHTSGDYISHCIFIGHRVMWRPELAWQVQDACVDKGVPLPYG